MPPPAGSRQSTRRHSRRGTSAYPTWDHFHDDNHSQDHFYYDYRLHTQNSEPESISVTARPRRRRRGGDGNTNTKGLRDWLGLDREGGYGNRVGMGWMEERWSEYTDRGKRARWEGQSWRRDVQQGYNEVADDLGLKRESRSGREPTSEHMPVERRDGVQSIDEPRIFEVPDEPTSPQAQDRNTPATSPEPRVADIKEDKLHTESPTIPSLTAQISALKSLRTTQIHTLLALNARLSSLSSALVAQKRQREQDSQRAEKLRREVVGKIEEMRVLGEGCLEGLGELVGALDGEEGERWRGMKGAVEEFLKTVREIGSN